jgi:uncharacterized protein (TIGR02246 family)
MYEIGRVRRILSLSVFAAMIVSCGAGGRGPATAAPHDRLIDHAAIRARVAAMESALNSRDAEAYSSAYLSDGDFIDMAGPRSEGYEVIRREIARLFATLPNDIGSISLAVRSIRFLAADVAVADCDVLPSGSRATYVMVRREGSWMVAAGRVLPPEERG